MKTILVVCGSGIATSTAAVYELKERLAERGVEAKLKQCDVFSVQGELEGVSVIAATCALKDHFPVPVVSAVPLLTGIGIDAAIDKIVAILRQ